MHYESSFQEFQGVQETNIAVYKQTLVLFQRSWLSKISWVTMHKMFDRRHLRCMNVRITTFSQLRVVFY